MDQFYNANLSGNYFDIREFLKTPQVIIRLVSLLFSIIVFACISSGAYERDTCLFNEDPHACQYGVVIGVIAFIACIAFLVGDAMFHLMSTVDQKKYYIMADVGFSGFWCFLWFVGFCYLTNRLTNSTVTVDGKIITYSNARASVAFSFFSIISWALQTYFAVKRYQSGVGELYATSDDVLDHQPYSGTGSGIGSDYTTNQSRGGPNAGTMYGDDQMIGGDLSGGGGPGSGGYHQQLY